MDARFKNSLDRYVKDKIPTGGFLRAVLENNLKEAFGRADEEATVQMKEIVMYCYNELPYTCWGSPEKVASWLSGKRLDKSTDPLESDEAQEILEEGCKSDYEPKPKEE